MTLFQILTISIVFLFLSLFLYYKKNIKINRKSKVKIAINPFLLIFISLLVTKIEYSGTIMYKIYGWPHSFLTYKIKDVVEGVLINEWLFNTHNLFIYLISVYLFYLSLILFITMFTKLEKSKQKNILLIIFILIFTAIFSVFILNKNDNKKVIDKPTINKVDYQVVEVIEEGCTSDFNCKLPFEYAMRSNCPYQAMCLNNKCSIICPKTTEWDRIKQAISNCSVESVFQTHSLQVTVKLKNGDTIEAFEPEIDVVFGVAKEFEVKCGKIILGTK